VDTAYLNADLQETIYMRPPKALNLEPGKVLQLKKSIYGLKQAGREWFNLLRESLKSMGWLQGQKEPCLFYRQTGGGQREYLIIYVDDIIVIAKDKAAVDFAKKQLSGKFKMKDLGELNYILGIAVVRDHANREFKLNQTGLIERTIKRFGLDVCKPSNLPMTKGQREASPGTELGPEGKTRYEGMIGSLLYIGRCTRPDIMASVGICARKVGNPTTSDEEAAERIFRYLMGTATLELAISGRGPNLVEGYSDADWATDKEDRKSVSGFAVYIYGTLVAWASRKQSCTALSTLEAEFVALGELGKELEWIRQLLDEIGEMASAIKVRCDNEAAIFLAQDPKERSRAKHIELKYFFIRQLIEEGKVSIEHVGSEQNVADTFTKPLGKHLFNKHKQSLHLVRRSTSGSVNGGVDHEIQK